jgi:hypothetical protein
MDDKKVRDLLMNMITAMTRLYGDREAMLAVMRESAKRTKVLEDWEETYKTIAGNPPAPISEAIAEIFQPLTNLVTSGLDEKGLQELHGRVRSLDQKLQEWQR